MIINNKRTSTNGIPFSLVIPRLVIEAHAEGFPLQRVKNKTAVVVLRWKNNQLQHGATE